MKLKIWLTVCLCSIGFLASCGAPEQASKEELVPSSAPPPIATPSVAPSPIAQPSPAPSPQEASPEPIKTPTGRPRVTLPKSTYPIPTPVTIAPDPPAVVKTKATQKDEPVTKLNLPADPAQKITPEGIGVAKIGMSFKELKQQAGTEVKFPVKTSLMDGFDAIAVTKAGKVQYYIPYPAGTQFTDQDRIQHLITDNPNYRTEKGVGPGTPLKQAAAVYGGATLSLSKENESREFVSFTQNPNGMAFRPKPVKSRDFAGEYPESNESYLKTQKYDARTAIGQVTVSCADEKCGNQEEPDSSSQKSGIKSDDSGTKSQEPAVKEQEPDLKSQAPGTPNNLKSEVTDQPPEAVKSDPAIKSLVN